MSERSSSIRFAVWLGLSILIFYLVFIGGGWLGIYATEIRSFNVAITAIGIAAWAIAAIRNPAWLPRSALMPAFLVALGAFAIGLALSRQPRIGFEYLAFSILLTALYLLLVRFLADAWFQSRVMGIVVVVTVLHGVAYLVEVVSTWMTWWDLVGRVTTPPLRPLFGSLLLGNPSAVMTVQVLLTLPSIAWLGWGTLGRRLTSAAILFLAVAATVLSGSRAGWVALAGAIALAAIAWLLSSERRSWLAARLRSRRARGGLVAVGGALLLAAVAFAPGVLFRAAGGGDAQRLANYAAAIRMFQDAPIQGTGPGTWVAQRITYTVPPEPDYYIPYAHNLPLQTLAEFGLIGALAGIVVVVLLGRLVWAAIRDPDPPRRRMGWAALLATLYFVAHQQLDFYGSSPTALFAYAIPIAFLDGTRAEAAEPARDRRRSRIVALAGTLAVAVAVGGLLAAEQVAATMSRAVTAANDGRWAQALPDAEAAVRQDPAMTPYQFALAVIADHASRPEVAATAWRRAAEADDLPVSWLGVASGHVRAGDQDAARQALDEALRVGDQQTAVLVAAGDLYLQLGDTTAATDSFSRALGSAPSLAGDPRWTDDPRLAAIREPVFQAARESLGSGGILLWLATSDFAAADAWVASLAPGDRDRMALVVRGWQGDPAAATTLREMAAAQPLALDTVLWAARVAAHQGDEASANELRLWAETLNGLSSIPSFDVGFAGADLRPDKVAGLGGRLYGHYTYRRPTPFDQIPAGLLQLELR